MTTLRKDDHVIPLYTLERRQCKFCLSRKTNLCQLIRGTQGKGLMPDAKGRFSLTQDPCTTWARARSATMVVPEIAVAKVREDAPFETIHIAAA